MWWCVFWYIRAPRIGLLRIRCWRRRRWICKNVSRFSMRVPNTCCPSLRLGILRVRLSIPPGFWKGGKNAGWLLCVSCEVFDLHGYDWIHWVAKSCTTTAYQWLFRDSQPSLRTLWSAVIKSPKFSARSTAPPMRLLHGALVILVLWQISQFRSSGSECEHCVYPNPHFSQV